MSSHDDDTPAKDTPRIAIIIPSYNRPDQIRDCIQALNKIDGAPYPIIVVDDGSDTHLDTVLALSGDHVSVIRQANAGPAAARNTGARAAEGAELLCFIDDDCRPRPDWITRLVAAQGRAKGRLVGGRIKNALPRNVFSSASQSLSSYLYDYYQSTGSEMTFFTTNNMCCRREDFLALGGFDTGFLFASEDRDLSLRWADAGGELHYAEDAVVDHGHDLTLTSFFRQHASYGRGAHALHRRMATRGDPRPKIEPVGFYAGMLTYPMRKRLYGSLRQSVLIGLSQVAMVSGYAMARRDARRAMRSGHRVQA